MVESSNVAPALKLEWTVDLDTVIGAEVEYTEDGPVYSGGIKLGEMVAQQLADKLAASATTLVREVVNRQSVSKKVDEAIDEAIDAKLAILIDREVIPTDHFGRATDGPTTLATRIEQLAAAWFAKPAGDRTSGTRQTNLEALVARVIDRKTSTELQAAVQQAMAEAKEQVQAVIAKMLADEAAKAVRKS